MRRVVVFLCVFVLFSCVSTEPDLIDPGPELVSAVTAAAFEDASASDMDPDEMRLAAGEFAAMVAAGFDDIGPLLKAMSETFGKDFDYSIALLGAVLGPAEEKMLGNDFVCVMGFLQGVRDGSRSHT